MPTFINDGYTQDATINAEAGLYERTEFKFRPQVYRERKAIQDQRDKISADKYDALLNGMLSKHVISWNHKEDVKSAATFATLHPLLKDYMLNIVMGYSAGDIQPTAPVSESDDYLKSLQQQVEGAHPGDVKAEADLKN